MAEETIYRDADPIKVKLMKMSKGYQWEISIKGNESADILPQVWDIDQQLRDKYVVIEEPNAPKD